MEKIEVCVRVRPLCRREIDRGETMAICTLFPKLGTQGSSEIVLEKQKIEGKDKLGENLSRLQTQFHFSRVELMKTTASAQIPRPARSMKRLPKRSSRPV
jgi:hypothetical protein